jgi:hypothetical protein
MIIVTYSKMYKVNIEHSNHALFEASGEICHLICCFQDLKRLGLCNGTKI